MGSWRQQGRSELSARRAQSRGGIIGEQHRYLFFVSALANNDDDRKADSFSTPALSRLLCSWFHAQRLGTARLRALVASRRLGMRGGSVRMREKSSAFSSCERHRLDRQEEGAKESMAPLFCSLLSPASLLPLERRLPALPHSVRVCPCRHSSGCTDSLIGERRGSAAVAAALLLLAASFFCL